MGISYQLSNNYFCQNYSQTTTGANNPLEKVPVGANNLWKYIAVGASNQVSYLGFSSSLLIYPLALLFYSKSTPHYNDPPHAE